MKEIMDTEKTYVGIDIGKEKIDFAVHTSDKRWSFSNDDAGIDKAVKAIGDISPLWWSWKPQAIIRRRWLRPWQLPG